MEETSRIAALEAALLAMDQRQQKNERALRRWRVSALLATVLGCVVLPQFTRESISAGNANATVDAKTNKRLKVIETALFGVSPVPTGAPDKITNVSTALTAEIKARQGAVTAEANARTAADNTLTANLTAETNARTAGDNTLGGNLTAEANARLAGDNAINGVISPFFALVSVSNGVGTGTEIVVNGANLHIQSGSGTTNGAINGLGNLIIGHNEARGAGNVRTGSHNLVLGTGQNFSSFGGLLAGNNNNVTGAFSSVVGGQFNTASGFTSAILGGQDNLASAFESTIAGGAFNVSSGAGAAISGGAQNTASGQTSSILGGRGITISADDGRSP